MSPAVLVVFVICTIVYLVADCVLSRPVLAVLDTTLVDGLNTVEDLSCGFASSSVG